MRPFPLPEAPSVEGLTLCSQQGHWPEDVESRPAAVLSARRPAREVELAEVVEAVSKAEGKLEELPEGSSDPEPPDRVGVDDWLHRTHMAYWAS
jgi:hypothetical protein